MDPPDLDELEKRTTTSHNRLDSLPNLLRSNSARPPLEAHLQLPPPTFLVRKRRTHSIASKVKKRNPRRNNTQLDGSPRSSTASRMRDQHPDHSSTRPLFLVPHTSTVTSPELPTLSLLSLSPAKALLLLLAPPQPLFECQKKQTHERRTKSRTPPQLDDSTNTERNPLRRFLSLRSSTSCSTSSSSRLNPNLLLPPLAHLPLDRHSKETKNGTNLFSSTLMTPR
ncbi:hypothetical protein BDY24DRAFT_153485 [Mrakia frigida]|uniref:uncharacterized protein n=1 Tax=Mrakia frigida TaxID=29902 RepID=UPI003FCBF85C